MRLLLLLLLLLDDGNVYELEVTGSEISELKHFRVGRDGLWSESCW